MVVGATEQPLIVDIRVRRSAHGGEGVKVEEEEIIEEDNPLGFAPKLNLQDLEKEFKGIEGPEFINYPIWMVSGTKDGKKAELMVDGITGEMVFQKDGGMERSAGIRSLLDLPPSSRLIVLYLMKTKAATPQKVSEELKSPLSMVQESIKELLGGKHITTDGYMLQNNFRLEVPQAAVGRPVSEKPGRNPASGVVLEFMVGREFASKVARLWSVDVNSVEAVYYPYWSVRKGGRRLLIDAVNSRVDQDLTEAVKKLL
jgi:hypothetical protein